MTSLETDTVYSYKLNSNKVKIGSETNIQSFIGTSFNIAALSIFGSTALDSSLGFCCINNDTFTNLATITLVKGSGDYSNISETQINQKLGNITFTGFETTGASGAILNNMPATISARAVETFSNTGHGTQMLFNICEIGTTGNSNAMIIHHNRYIEMASGLTVSGNLIPDTNGTRSLGSSTNQWKDIYVSGGTIYLEGITLSTNGTNLMWSGSTIEGNPAGNTFEIQINSGGSFTTSPLFLFDIDNSATTIGTRSTGTIGAYSFSLGVDNIVSAENSSVIGGTTHEIKNTAISSSIIGGNNNTISNPYNIIMGGNNNLVNNDYGIIIGGSGNTVVHDRSTIIGCYDMTSLTTDTVYVPNLEITTPSSSSLIVSDAYNGDRYKVFVSGGTWTLELMPLSVLILKV